VKPGQLLIVGDDVQLEADDKYTVFMLASQTPVVFVSEENPASHLPNESDWNTVTILTPIGLLYVLRRDLRRSCYDPNGGNHG
jgi:hypothetical protein